MMKLMRRFWPVVALMVLSWPGSGYSVLTHEAIIDAAWPTHIRPLLMARFPEATAEEIEKAHAYVYGGALVNDIGYSPLSSHFVSDLAHYVRPGDLVEAAIQESQTLNEYAFSLGMLAHYVGDTVGHPAVNRITWSTYKKLQRKFPKGVAYEDAPAEHLKTEFALDVIQVARGAYAPDAYHSFIGFEIDSGLLERVFPKVYGVKFQSQFLSEDLAIGTYRYAVGSVIPKMTRVAWSSKRSDIEKLTPGITRKKYFYHYSRKDYEKEWGKTYKKPGCSERILALLFRLVPVVGPFKALAFRPVSAQSEKLFLTSLDESVARYRELLGEVRQKRLRLAETNLDVGRVTAPGEYRLADETYAKLLHELAEAKQEAPPAEMVKTLRRFLRDPKRLAKSVDREKVAEDLATLREGEHSLVP